MKDYIEVSSRPIQPKKEELIKLAYERERQAFIDQVLIARRRCEEVMIAYLAAESRFAEQGGAAARYGAMLAAEEMEDAEAELQRIEQKEKAREGGE